ncbi:MAG TPA: FtsH protease activity modulator HflK [Hyphomicrobiales bacterium]|nr:FtsH protease activity modulator HflK [Hyphomicrobiales bacterium]
MPWNNQGGGPRRPIQGPWGGGPPSPGGRRPPNFEDLLRGGQDRVRRLLPGGGAGGMGIVIVFVVAVLIWAATGIYTVQPGEVGVVQRFGAFVRQEGNGLHYHWPYPIETVDTVDVAHNRRTDIGLRFDRAGGTREVPEESLMLTGDGNIVDITFSVLWTVSDAPKYLFDLQDPPATVKAIAESAMREVVGRSDLQSLLTQGRAATETAVQKLMQGALDSYGAGVLISQVPLQKVDPPEEVIAAFRDVQAARADQERMQNEAETYANRVVPNARGKAAAIVQAAEAYKSQSVAEAQGQAARFDEVYASYKAAPAVTRERMFLETMEKLFGPADKIVLDTPGSTAPLTYLPLDRLLPRPPAPSRPAAPPASPASQGSPDQGPGQSATGDGGGQ